MNIEVNTSVTEKVHSTQEEACSHYKLINQTKSRNR